MATSICVYSRRKKIHDVTLVTDPLPVSGNTDLAAGFYGLEPGYAWPRSSGTFGRGLSCLRSRDQSFLQIVYEFAVGPFLQKKIRNSKIIIPAAHNGVAASHPNVECTVMTA